MVEATLRHLRGLGRGDIASARLARVIAWAGLFGLALRLAWRDSAALWPAAALAAALSVDAAARLAAAGLARRAGPDPRIVGLPSLVLGVTGTAGLVLGAAALLLVPRAAPVLASALAGLVAIGAFARLALIRAVVGLRPHDPDASPNDPPCPPSCPIPMSAPDRDRLPRPRGGCPPDLRDHDP